MRMIMDIRKIMERYEGEIREDEGEISISAKNFLTRYENIETEDGIKMQLTVRRPLCVIKAKDGAMEGYESTCEILGGFGNMPLTEKGLAHELERYGFKKKEEPKYEQLTLF